MFPYQAKLISEPDSEYARENMTVGQTYWVLRQAGSCVEVTTDIHDDKTLIWQGRLERVLH